MALKRLESIRGDRRARAEKLKLLGALEKTSLARADQVYRLHEIACFLRTYPDDKAVLVAADGLLAHFGQRKDLKRHRGRLAGSGIDGTAIHCAFYWQTAQWLAARFGEDVVEPWSKDGTSYAIRGGLGTWCKSQFPGCEYDVLAAEFGTRQILTVIRALRSENQAHLYAEPGSPAYEAAKKELKQVFAPSETDWRESVVGRGLGIVQTAIEAALTEG